MVRDLVVFQILSDYLFIVIRIGSGNRIIQGSPSQHTVHGGAKGINIRPRALIPMNIILLHWRITGFKHNRHALALLTGSIRSIVSGSPEINQDRFSFFIQEYIFRADITMDNVFLMQLMQ